MSRTPNCANNVKLANALGTQARANMSLHSIWIAAQRDEILRLAEQCAQPRSPKTHANEIDAAVYELKAVNPRARDESDTRTPSETVNSIATHGAMVAHPMSQLRSQLASTVKVC